MIKIEYKPEDAGKEFLTRKGKTSHIRKYHLTDEEMFAKQHLWLSSITEVDKKIIEKAGKYFFNPYRQGIYYYQVQTLFLLGANEWHSLPDIVSKLKEYTSSIYLSHAVMEKTGYNTAWEQFRGKSSRNFARTSKDYVGRIQENFVMLQRLSKKHPLGYKMYQVRSAIDVKRINAEGFSQGLYHYRLSTYNDYSQAFPIKDYSEFTFPKDEGNYISKKFIGTIVTSDKIIKGGVVK